MIKNNWKAGLLYSGIILVFISCSTGNKVVSSFGKRKYTGGYYFNWHKSLESKFVAKEPKAKNEIIQSNNSFMGKGESQSISNIEETIDDKEVYSITHVVKENTKTISNIPSPRMYIITPGDTIPNYQASNEDDETTKKHANAAVDFGVLGFFAGLVLGFVVTVEILGRNSGNSVGIILLLPLTLVIISLIHCYHGLKGGHHDALIFIVLLDLICVAILIAAIIGLLFLIPFYAVAS